MGQGDWRSITPAEVLTYEKPTEGAAPPFYQRLGVALYPCAPRRGSVGVLRLKIQPTVHPLASRRGSGQPMLVLVHVALPQIATN
jgi:hypothetical protein